MFKTKIFEIALELLAKYLENPKRDKVREFLTSDKVQALMAAIFGGYFALIEQLEDEEGTEKP